MQQPINRTFWQIKIFAVSSLQLQENLFLKSWHLHWLRTMARGREEGWSEKRKGGKIAPSLLGDPYGSNSFLGLEGAAVGMSTRQKYVCWLKQWIQPLHLVCQWKLCTSCKSLHGWDGGGGREISAKASLLLRGRRQLGSQIPGVLGEKMQRAKVMGSFGTREILNCAILLLCSNLPSG